MSAQNGSLVSGALSELSPAMRKLLAIAILFFGLFILWSLVLAPVVSQTDASLIKLQDTRFQLARLENLQARPEPEKADALPVGLLLEAVSRDEAASLVQSYVNGLAAQNELQMASLNLRPEIKGSKIIALDFAILGDELAITDFINRLESGLPLMRFKSWQIESSEPVVATEGEPSPSMTDPRIQFSGQIVAAWMKI